jgi:TonB family protein
MIVLATALYWIAIGTVCLAGSALVARVLRRHGRQERWAWATGLAGALALPLVLPLLGAPGVSPDSPVGSIGPAAVIDLAPMRVGVAATPDLTWLAPALIAAWAALSSLLLLRFLSAARTVARVRRDARPAPDHGEHVRVTRADGPAVAGFVRPIILIPEWVLALPGACRAWILRHEEEHIRGRDPGLLGFVLLARVAVPWNPVVWLFDRSIRSAIETDCDRRTIEPGGDIHSYSEALFAVAGGRSARDSLPAMAPAFAESRVPLDHRIETVTTPRRSLGTFLRLALASVAGLAVAAACEMPAPTQTDGGGNEVTAIPATGAEAVAVADSTDDGPRFTPYDVAPRLTNSSEVVRVLEREYPPLLKDSGIGGEVTVWLYVDESGDVAVAQVRDDPPGTSGYEALDAAALAVADAMVFTPAENLGRTTAVWVQIPITFTTDRGAYQGSEADAPEYVERRVDELRGSDTGQYASQDPDQPRFIPYDVAPRLENSREVAESLEREYPPLLKNAGIGGEVVVWLYIDENGEVGQALVRDDPPGTSGYEPLDAAALAVAEVMDFTPAENLGRTTAVWVQIPITFTVGN